MGSEKLSTGFTGSATRGMSGFDKEVETRIKKMDVFTDDFSPPGTAESFPGGNFNKRDAPYGKPHDDFPAESKLHSVGDPADQEKMDWLDQMANSLEAPIKNPNDQFPGAVDMEDHKEIAKFDPHLTDPARLKKMSNNLKDPKAFNDEVEKRMKHLAIESKKTGAEKIEPELNKDDQYVPSVEGEKNKKDKAAEFNL